jgi:hypothetical protein
MYPAYNRVFIPPLRFTAEELSLLLEEMGFDSLDLRGFRVHAVSGARLLDMSEDDMAIDLVLPRSKVRASRRRQWLAFLGQGYHRTG